MVVIDGPNQTTKANLTKIYFILKLGNLGGRIDIISNRQIKPSHKKVVVIELDILIRHIIYIHIYNHCSLRSRRRSSLAPASILIFGLKQKVGNGRLLGGGDTVNTTDLGTMSMRLQLDLSITEFSLATFFATSGLLDLLVTVLSEDLLYCAFLGILFLVEEDFVDFLVFLAPLISMAGEEEGPGKEEVR